MKSVMAKKLLQLIEQIIKKEDVGTLFLGKGEQVRHIFFSGDEVHLLEAGKECRFVPAPHLFMHSRASDSALSDLLSKLSNQHQSLGSALERVGLLTEERLPVYLEMEMFEEILLIVDRSGQHFLFEAGNVPEALLLGADDQHVSIPNQPLLQAIKSREQEKREIAEILPRLDEKLVLSDRGQEAMSGERHWVFGEIGAVIDGTSSVSEVLEKSLFFPHRTLVILCAAARQGWVQKTLFRELEDIDYDQLDAKAANDLVLRYIRAAEMSTDQVPVRERLIDLLEYLGKNGRAIEQLTLVGDAYKERGDVDKALSLYERALAIDPSDTKLKDKVFEIFYSRATLARDRDEQDETRRYLEECTRVRPEQIDLYEEVLATFGDDEARVSKEALRVIDLLRKEHRDQRARDFLERVMLEFPESIALRRRHVNFLLDAGNTAGAIAGLEVLRKQLKSAGENAEAQDIQKKIERLTPKELPAEPDGRSESKKRLSLAGLTLCGLLTAFGGYQQHTYQMLDTYRNQFDALASAEIPVPGSPGFRQEQVRTRNFVDALREFHGAHPVMIWGPAIQRVMLSAEDRLFYLDHSSRREFERLLNTANAYESRGQFESARTWYLLLEKKGRGTDWGKQATDRLEKLDNYLSEAKRLLAAGQAASAAGDFEESFVIYRTLLLDYSRTDEAKGIRLPVVIRTKPGGAEVWADDERLGKAPVVVHVPPFEAMEIKIQDSRGRTTTHYIEGPLEHVITIKVR